MFTDSGIIKGTWWSWLYSSWIDSYLCYQCLSTPTLWVRIPLRQGVLDTTLCDKVCQWLATDRWFSPVSSIEIDRLVNSWHIVEIGVKHHKQKHTQEVLYLVSGSNIKITLINTIKFYCTCIETTLFKNLTLVLNNMK